MLQKKLRKMGAWVLAFALAVGPVQGIPVKAEESQANLALEATATASDTESGNEVYKINDGKSDTRWAANQGNTERWVQPGGQRPEDEKLFDCMGAQDSTGILH